MILYIILTYIALGLLTLGYLYTFEKEDMDRANNQSFSENNGIFTKSFLSGLMNLVIVFIWPYMVYCTIWDGVIFLRRKLQILRVKRLLKKVEGLKKRML